MNQAKIIKNKDYKNLIDELKSIITNGQHHASKAIDNIRVQTYWQIGERIVREDLKYKDKAGYGKYLIDNLVVDLNVSKRLLHQIIKFYQLYPIVHTLRAQLSWKHYVALIPVIDLKERSFYEIKTINYSWSVRELSRQIKNKLYLKTDSKEIETTLKTNLPAVINIKNVFKPEYDLGFLAIESSHQEKELETKIINSIENFLKELGGDFMFLGRQVPIVIDGQKHFIDLVLFHRGIPCPILVDLKVGKLDSRDIGHWPRLWNMRTIANL